MGNVLVPVEFLRTIETGTSQQVRTPRWWSVRRDQQSLELQEVVRDSQEFPTSAKPQGPNITWITWLTWTYVTRRLLRIADLSGDTHPG